MRELLVIFVFSIGSAAFAGYSKTIRCSLACDAGSGLVVYCISGGRGFEITRTNSRGCSYDIVSRASRSTIKNYCGDRGSARRVRVTYKSHEDVQRCLRGNR